jgi:hypothetical protein
MAHRHAPAAAGPVRLRLKYPGKWICSGQEKSIACVLWRTQ